MSHHDDWRRRAHAIEKSAVRILDDKLFAASWERMVVLAAMQDALFTAWADQQLRGWSRADMVTKRHFEAMRDALGYCPSQAAPNE